MYSVATSGGGTLMPQMKTFYQKPASTPVSVAPYATTTLINTSGNMGGSSTMSKPMQSNVSTPPPLPPSSASPPPLFFSLIPAGSPSRGGDVAVYVSDIFQLSSPTPFYSVLVFVFLALSTIFHSVNSPSICSLSHCVRLVLFFPYWSFQLYISMKVRILCG